jgi:hypothetical protein
VHLAPSLPHVTATAWFNEAMKMKKISRISTLFLSWYSYVLCIGIEIIISTCFEKWGMVKVVIYFEALFVPITFIGMVIVHAEIEEQIGALGSTVWHNKWLWSGSMDCLSFFRKESSLPSSAQCHYFLHDMRVPSKKFFLTSSRLGGELLASLRSLLVG